MAYGNLAHGTYGMAQNWSGAQARHLGGMAGQINSVIGDEMDSRVAQIRELRRMMHQQYLEELRIQADRERIAAQRYAVEQDSRDKQRERKMAAYMNKQKLGLPTTKHLINGRWVEEYDL